MENKDQNNTVPVRSGSVVASSVDNVVLPPDDLGSLSLEKSSVDPLSVEQPADGHKVRHFLRSTKTLDIILGAVLLLVMLTITVFVARNSAYKDAATNAAASQFTTTKIPLGELLSSQDLSQVNPSNVTINGSLQVSGSIGLAPSLQPTGAKPGQIYFDKGNNQLAYFNGSNFVFLTSPQQTPGGVQSLGGATGQLSLGGGLSLTGGQLSNTGVLAVQGASGNVSLTAGPGIIINGTNFSNSGVLSVAAGSPNVTVANNGSGGVTISVASPIAGTGTVTSSGGSAGKIPLFTAAQNVEDSIISQAGLAVTVAGDLAVSGNLTLSAALSVTQGGTGTNNLAANGVLVGSGTGAINSITAGASGLCLMSSGGAPVWSACPGGGGGGVSSINGLTGVLNIANASGAGSTITINDATTSSKGIASFNSNNLTVTSGAVNTIQDIGTGATPTFTGINTSGISPTGVLLTVGSTSAQLLLQGNAATVLKANNGANSTTVSFQSPTAAVTYRFLTATAGTYDICTTQGNCVGTGGSVSTSGGAVNRLAKFTAGQAINDSTISDDGTTVITSVDMVVQGGDLTIGTPTAQSGTVNLASNSSSFLGSIVQGALSANRTYTLPDVSGTICLSSGNCPSSGVTSLNGLSGSISIANASAAGSTITINDASTSTKGIASFNATNFSVTSGAVNTIQDIHSGASPTFAGVNTNTITPSSSLTIGATGQSLLLQGNAATSLVAHNGASATTVNFQSPTANVTYRFLTAGAGTYDICTTQGNCVGTGGGVSTTGGTTNRLAKFSGSQAINDSSITDDGTNVLTSIDMVVQGGDLTVGVPTTQTGTINLANNGSGFLGSIIQGALSANRTYTLPDASGTICVSSGNCSGGVTSLNGLVGALNIANASAAGSTITINDASTSAKGIASFNGTNFTASGGTINIIQDINTSASPTFVAVNTNTITPSGALTVGSTSQTATLRGSTTTISSNGAGNNIVLNSANTIELQGASNITGNATVSGTFKSGTANAFQVAANGNIITAGTAVINGASVTVGSASQAGSLVLNDGAGKTATLGVATLGQNTTYTLPDPGVANVSICLTSGNCAGSGGGVTSAGGTTNRLAKFSGANAIADSSISDSAGIVSTTSDLIIQGGDVTVGVANAQTGTINLAHSGSSFLGSIIQGALSSNQSYTLPDTSGTICLSSGNCSGSGSSNTLQASYDAGNTITTSNARNIAFTLADTTTDANFTVDVASGSTGYVAFRRVGGGAADPAQLLLLDNLHTTRALPVGLKIQSSGGGGVTTAIDASAAGITTALSAGTAAITGTTGSVTYSNFSINGANGNISAGTYNGQTISSSASFTGTVLAAGNITSSGNLAANGGSVTSTGALNITPGGTLTVGVTGQQLILQGNASTQLTATGGGFTTGVGFSGTPTGAVTYNFDRAATAGTYTICTTIGNCAGSGGGVTTSGGTTGTIPVFTGSQAIGNSLLSQSGGTVTANGNLNLTTGNQYQINGTQISSANLSNDANIAKLSASQTFTGNAVVFQNATNSTNAFAVQNSLNNAVLSVDTSGAQVILGKSSSVNGKLVFANASNANTTTLDSGTPTAARTISLPDASGTVCLQSSTSCGFAAASGSSSYIQNGTTLQNANLAIQNNGATSDITALIKQTSGQTGDLLQIQNSSAATMFSINQFGQGYISGALTTGSAVGIGVGANSGEQLRITAANSGTVGLTVNANNSGQTANVIQANAPNSQLLYTAAGIFSLQQGISSDFIRLLNSSGNTIAKFDTNGNLFLGNNTASGTIAGKLSLTDGTADGFAGSLVTTTLTANRTYTLPDATGTVCLSTGNCPASGNFIQNGTGSQTANFNIQSAAAGSITALIQGAASQSVDILEVKANGVSNSLLSVGQTGATTLRNSANSSAAFQIQNANATATVFQVDSSNNLVRIMPVGTINNNSNASGTGALQVGADNTFNIGIDDNDIIARNNGSAGTLFLQKTGGGLTVKANATVFQNASDSSTAYQILNNAGNVTVMDADTSNGRIGIGTDTPLAGLHVERPLMSTSVGQNFNILAVDNAAAAQNVGGGIGFGGYADSLRAFAGIQGLHESATSTDYAGALSFLTRPSGNTSLFEQARIGSTGQTTFKNSTNSTTAFRIQNANASTTVFNVDTQNATVTVSSLTVSGTLTVNGHLITGGSTPTITAGTAACTTPTVSVSGNDTAGLITITTGTGCAASGKMATVNFASAFASAPRVVLTAAESNAARKSYYVDSATITTAGFDIDVTVSNTDTTTYKWYYHTFQ